MNHTLRLLAALGAASIFSACTTVSPNTIRDVNDSDVKRCTLAGTVSGADAVFVGLSAGIGSKNAKAKATNEAIRLKATDIVWSQRGTSMTSEWIGKAYVCR